MHEKHTVILENDEKENNIYASILLKSANTPQKSTMV
jgi:hypothetical protein